MEIPIKLSIISPKIAKSNKIADAIITDLFATRRRSFFDSSCVKEKKIGVNPIGSTITKRVTKEVINNVASIVTHKFLTLMHCLISFVLSPKDFQL